MTTSTTPKSLTPDLCVKASMWAELLGCLKTKCAGRRESGAFLLGQIRSDGVRQVESVVLYDAIEPASFERFAVRMSPAGYSKLFGLCNERDQRVVADVHAHPRLAFQSPSDRANPLVPMVGHVALIVPNYAKHPVHLKDMTFNVYGGPGRWFSVTGPAVANHLEIQP